MAAKKAGAEAREVQRWLDEIDRAKKHNEDKWYKRARRVIDRYEDERGTHSTDSRAYTADGDRMSILWSNTEVLQSALMPTMPEPDVRRRFTESDQTKVARTVSSILERATTYEADCTDMEYEAELALRDALVPGRGQLWVEYDPEIIGDEENARVGKQKLSIYRTHWEDFLMSGARSWKHVTWVCRRLRYSREEYRKAFPGKQLGQKVLMATQTTRATDAKVVDEYEVYEVWDKVTRSRFYVCHGVGEYLRRDKDPYRLKEFFPCPEPYATITKIDDMTPIPEYTLYQDLADELDETTSRLNNLISHLKWNGIYDASADDGDQTLASMAGLPDGQFLPHKNFSQVRDKGGIEAAFGFRPIERIFPVVQALAQHRDQLVQQIYEVTGISDIIRGATDPRETKGAQQLKAQFGSMRMKKRDARFQNFIRDTYRIMSEIIAEHYQPEMLSEMTGIVLKTNQDKEMARMQAQQMQAAGQKPPPPPPWLNDPTWEDVLEVMRSDRRTGYRVQVESDATAIADADAETQRRTQFLEVMGATLEKAYQAAATAPQSMPLVKELTLFTVRSFKAGRAVEESIEDTFDALMKQPPQPPQEKKGGTDPRVDQARLEMEGKKAAAGAAVDQAKVELEEKKLGIQAEKDAAEIEREKAKDAAEIELKREELALKRDELAQEAEYQRADIEIKRAGVEVQRGQLEIQEVIGMEKLRLGARTARRDQDLENDDVRDEQVM